MRLAHPVKQERRRTDHQRRSIERAQKCESLQGLPQPHFICENPAKTVSAQKTQPVNTFLLIRAENPFQGTKRLRLERHELSLRTSPVLPFPGALDGSSRQFSESGIDVRGLASLNSVSSRARLGRITISEDRLKFFQTVRVENRQTSISQSRDALPDLQQALDLRGRKLLPTADSIEKEKSNQSSPEPMISQLRRYPFDVCA